MARIDTGLAADAGIDLRQQRGRHLHEIHPATRYTGGETRQIADNAAAEGDERVAAFHAGRQDARTDGFQGGEVFRLLAGGNAHCLVHERRVAE